MDPQPEVNMTGNGDLGSLNEVQNDTVSGRVEARNGLTEGNNFADVLLSNGGHYWDLPASNISDLMKLGSLEKVSTQALFSVVNRILEKCTERKNEDIPQRVAAILKLVVQEIQQRYSKQAQNMRKQSTLYKSREERYQSKIRVLETLATGSTEENEVVLNQLQQMKTQKTKIEEMKKLEEQDLIKLRQEKDHCESLILSLEVELKLAKKAYEENCFQLESEAEETKDKLQKQILELEQLLADSRNKVKEIEEFSQSKLLRLERKEHGYSNFIDSQFESLKDLKLTSESIKEEVSKLKNIYAEEFFHFGLNLKDLIDAAQNYHSVLDENRKLYNEVQDLKGNIRVYCRVRPFLPGQSRKQTTIQYIGENGELVVTNPSKPGKDSHRAFKFNKVFGPASTQVEVFQDTQPLIRSVLDGYNVCIFAYGQTGSGKTYTMTGPNMTSVVDWGVNYRALNDLFNISQNRHSSIAYEVGVQMVEIYNEQVRDLLCNASFQKRLGIWNTSQPNGLAVPDASMHPVRSTTDVLELMNIGLTNRAVGATALNERSSRSHSILTVHVRGTDLETNVVLRGCLHLVDLAGSERVHRSEATGDRLREAQHINKSLSALGDVISALAQKNPHVPYRNSKLTQVLQSSLGGQAKTLMFVQLNPDVESYSETISTLKFAERVSGVELGAAQSNKEGRGVRELMEQVASLKDAVAKKDEEIGRLRLLKANNGNFERIGVNSPRRNSIEPPLLSQQFSAVKNSSEKVTSDPDHISEYSDKHSDAASQQSMDAFRHHKEFFQQSRLATLGGGENFPEDSGDADSEEKLSVTSDGVLSMGTETDASINNTSDITQNRLNVPIELRKPPTSAFSRLSLSKSSSKVPSSKRATLSSSSALKLPRRFN